MKNYFLFSFCVLLFACKPTQSNISSVKVGQSFQFQLSPPLIDYDAVFFENNTEVRLKLSGSKTKIHYTLDGSVPTQMSPVYDAPIKIKTSSTLKAKAFNSDFQPSETVAAQFLKINKPPAIREIALANPPHDNYKGTGAASLMDMKKGTLNFREPTWMGFSENDIELAVTFEKKRTFQNITASMLADVGSWIFLPKAIEIYTSDNGENYTKVKTQTFEPLKENAPKKMTFLTVEVKPQNTAYLKVVIKNGMIPNWHPGKGTPAWLFIDEIVVE